MSRQHSAKDFQHICAGGRTRTCMSQHQSAELAQHLREGQGIHVRVLPAELKVLPAHKYKAGLTRAYLASIARSAYCTTV